MVKPIDPNRSKLNNILELTPDIVGLVDALNQEQAVIAGMSGGLLLPGIAPC
jgi:hypothetical protein